MALLLIYLGYLFTGAIIFYFIEHSNETERRAIELEERIKINGKFITTNRILLSFSCV